MASVNQEEVEVNNANSHGVELIGVGDMDFQVKIPDSCVLFVHRMPTSVLNEARMHPSVQNIARIPTSRIAPKYNMSHKKRGKAIILYNETYDEKKNRLKDEICRNARTLIDALETLGFAVVTHYNSTKEEILKILKDAAEENHKDHDCIFVCAVAMGNAEAFETVDNGTISTKQIWENFTADKCPTLAGKPKMFFMIYYDPTMTNVLHHAPTDADYLVSYSKRDKLNEPWLMQELAAKLNSHGENCDMLEILTLISQMAANDSHLNTRQTPHLFSTLTQLLVLGKKN